MKPDPASIQQIEHAVRTLQGGGVIGLPTETVYGLAADARNAEAVGKIFTLKGRPSDHPLIVHIAETGELASWARDVPEPAHKLAAAFWPGPLTLILRRHAAVPAVVTGGQDSVGLRCPAHPLALQVLKRFGGGLAAPSANRFGRISPTTAQHVRDEFGDAVPVVLDGGECEVGIESTIVDLTGGAPRILRPGKISRAAIEAVIGAVAMGSHEHSPRASGTLEAHYAPRTPVWLLSREVLMQEANQQEALGRRVALLLLGHIPVGYSGAALPADAEGYAHGLYATLRELDAKHAHLLLVEKPPQDEDWLAINDRLRRAAAGAGEDDT